MSEGNRTGTLQRKEIPGGRRNRGRLWWLPVLYTLPFLAAALFLVLRLGPDIRNLIQVIIKLVVRG